MKKIRNIMQKILNKIKEVFYVIKTSVKECFFFFKYKGDSEVTALLLCHALEKGMGMNNVKKGYGKEKAIKLISILKKLENENKLQYAYNEAKSVLNAYIKYHTENGEEINYIIEKFNELNVGDESNLLNAGYNVVDKEELLKGKQCNFEKLMKSRHSVRYFSNENIIESEFLQAVELAKYAPSACNRQPWRVYYTLDKEKNLKLSQCVPGNKGFERDIPYYCVVTIDRKYFGGNEIYQWYLNGGIFVSYLTLAMNSIGIGNCIFQYPDFFESENDIKKILEISDSEVITSIVGYRKYAEKRKCIVASRKPSDAISKQV